MCSFASSIPWDRGLFLVGRRYSHIYDPCWWEKYRKLCCAAKAFNKSSFIGVVDTESPFSVCGVGHGIKQRDHVWNLMF